MQGDEVEAGDERTPQEAGASREEKVSRLRGQQAAITDRIASLEPEEPQTARNGKAR